MKKIALMLGLLLIAPALGFSAETKSVKIGVIQLTAPYAVEIEEAFHKTLNSFGYQEGTNLTYIKKIGKAEQSGYDVNRAFAKKMLEENVDILVTIGTGASVPVWPMVKENGKTQQIFIGVTYPVQSGLVKQVGVPSGENITGVSYGVAPEVRLKIFRTLFPDKKRFQTAAFVCSTALEQEQLYMKELETLKQNYDFKLKCVDFYNPTTKQADFAMAKKKLAAEDIDLIFGWYFLDTFIAQSEETRKYFMDMPLPIMAISSHLTDMGTIGGILTNHFQLGAQGAEMAVKIIGGVPAASIPTEEPREYLLEINLKKAKALNIVIPEEAIKLAYRVIQ